MSAPVVSVIMPVYNTREKYLREAIESILNQTFNDFELVIVNDGSTDENCEKVLLSYNDNRIKYYKNSQNSGLVYTRNRLLELAQGEYIANMDSDDVSFPNRLEKQIEYFKSHPEISLLGSWAISIPSNDTMRAPKSIKIMDIISDCPCIHPTVMFRRADFEKYGLKYSSNLISAEDYDLYASAIKYVNITNIQEPLLYYRRHGNNVSNKLRTETIVDSFKVQDKLLSYLSDDEKIKNKILDLAYTKKVKKSGLLQNIFSINNLYKNYAKFKLITILGLEFTVKVKSYQK